MGRGAHFPATCQCLACHCGLLLLLSAAKEMSAYLEVELIKVIGGEEAELRMQVETFTSSAITTLVLLPASLMFSRVITPSAQSPFCYLPVFSILFFR